MDIAKLKELNEKILDKAMMNVEKAWVMDKWDCECMETMSLAIDNLKDLEKMQKHETSYATVRKMDARTETTEFEQCVYDVLKKHEGEKGVMAVITVIAETMEDMKILNKKMYERTMMKIKELK